MSLTDTLHQRCHVPYSGEPEICVLQGSDGRFYPGCRIENVSFPLTISAVQNAFTNCLSEGAGPAVLFANEKSAAQTYWLKEYEVTVKPLEEADSVELANPVVEEVNDAGPVLADLLNKAVIPHSNFAVSALVELTDGRVVPGVNIETASWEHGLCAERVAIAKALSFGYGSFKSIHIHTRHGEYSSPCGACRQVILEHMPEQPVHIYHPDGSVSYHFSSDLLPFSFKSNFLKDRNRD